MIQKNRLFFLLQFLVQTAFAQQADSTLQKMNELVVSADRFEEKYKDLPRQIDLINKKQIQQLNQQTAADLLVQTGNVFVQKSQQDGGSPIIRGFEANRVLLVLDGVRLNNAIYRSGHLQNVLRIDQNTLEKVEVLYGPGSLMYGSDALGGVVHFVSVKPKLDNGLTGTVSSKYSFVNNELTNAFGLSYSGKKWGVLANYTFSDFGDLKQGKNRSSEIGNLGLRPTYQARENNKDVIRVNDDPNVQVGSAYNQNNLMAKFIFQPKSTQQHIIYYTQSGTGDIPRYDRLTEMAKDTPVYGDWYYGPEKFKLFSYQFEDSKKRLIADQIKMVASTQRIEESRISRNFGSTKQTHREEKVDVYSLNLDFKKNWQIHELRYGFEYANNQVSSNAFVKNINTNATSPASTRYPDGGSSMAWFGAYLNVNHELSEKLILSEGIRINHTNLKSIFINKSFYEFLPDLIEQKNTSLCGNIGLVYLIQKQSKIYANVGNAFRSPNVDDMGKIFDSKVGSALIMPNANLKPEQTVTAEIGTQLMLSKKLSLEANGYYTRLWNAIVVAPATINGADSLLYDGKLTATYTMANAQNAYLFGYHFQIEYELNKRIKIQSGVNYTYGRILGDSIMPMDHVPPLFGRSSISYKHKRINASIYSLYSAAKKLEDYYLNGEDNIQYATLNGMPAWITLNIQGGVKLTKKENVMVNIGLENILDQNYRTFASGMSAAGRNLWLNLRVNF